MKIDKKVLNQTIEKWGISSQIIMTIEELSELSQALCKTFRKDQMDISNIIEEMADVYIMLEQIKCIFGLPDIQAKIDKKMKRLKQLLKEEK